MPLFTATFKINSYFWQNCTRKSYKSINQLNCRQFGNVFKAIEWQTAADLKTQLQRTKEMLPKRKEIEKRFQFINCTNSVSAYFLMHRKKAIGKLITWKFNFILCLCSKVFHYISTLIIPIFFLCTSVIFSCALWKPQRVYVV